MIEADTADSSAAPGVQDAATPSPALALFAEWCSCVKFVAPLELNDEERDAAYDLTCDRAEEILLQLGAIAMGDDLAMGALLWITTWNLTRMVDRHNGAIPHLENAPQQRWLVLNIASHYPDLARIAGLPEHSSNEDEWTA